MSCGYEWNGEQYAGARIAIVHHCDLDADHVGEPHACRCGATMTFNHDDPETQAVEGTP